MLKRLQREIGVAFDDPALLLAALTHPSYLSEHPESGIHNQRLEFLGDAVLGLVAAEYFYSCCPEEQEGRLTRMRASVVCEPALARIAERLSLGSFVRLGRGEELSGGRQRASVLADALEAVAAAIYLDRGWEQARAFLLQVLDAEMIKMASGLYVDYKTTLQELVQQGGNEPLTYRILSEAGPDHDKSFTAGVFWKGTLIGQGSGRSKKEAEQQAARVALACTKSAARVHQASDKG